MFFSVVFDYDHFGTCTGEWLFVTLIEFKQRMFCRVYFVVLFSKPHAVGKYEQSKIHSRGFLISLLMCTSPVELSHRLFANIGSDLGGLKLAVCCVEQTFFFNHEFSNHQTNNPFLGSKMATAKIQPQQRFC